MKIEFSPSEKICKNCSVEPLQKYSSVKGLKVPVFTAFSAICFRKNPTKRAVIMSEFLTRRR